MSAHPVIDQRRRGAARDVVVSGEMDLGVVSRLLPPALVRQVVAECGRTGRRVRVLPAVLMVYFVIGLGLFSGQGYREVLRKVTGGAGLGRYPLPTSPALARARRRLGAEPLERLFGGLCPTCR